ncbi:MAG: hypothetical protein ACXVBW_07350, partial [Bdellovibrionota bacterium]
MTRTLIAAVALAILATACPVQGPIPVSPPAAGDPDDHQTYYTYHFELHWYGDNLGALQSLKFHFPGKINVVSGPEDELSLYLPVDIEHTDAADKLSQMYRDQIQRASALIGVNPLVIFPVPAAKDCLNSVLGTCPRELTVAVPPSKRLPIELWLTGDQVSLDGVVSPDLVVHLPPQGAVSGTMTGKLTVLDGGPDALVGIDSLLSDGTTGSGTFFARGAEL